MKREEILKRAIEKAVEHGWDYDMMYTDMNQPNNFRKYLCANLVHTEYYKMFLFDHSFTKAFSVYIHKTNQYKKLNDYSEVINRHYDHLQKQFEKELVWSKDRLEYISKFL